MSKLINTAEAGFAAAIQYYCGAIKSAHFVKPIVRNTHHSNAVRAEYIVRKRQSLEMTETIVADNLADILRRKLIERQV